jgi:hypothetical protein
MPTPELSNTAMYEAAEQLLTIVKKGANLRYGNPGHLKLAMDVGDLLVSVIKITGRGAVFTTYSHRCSTPMA